MYIVATIVCRGATALIHAGQYNVPFPVGLDSLLAKLGYLSFHMSFIFSLSFLLNHFSSYDTLSLIQNISSADLCRHSPWLVKT